MSDQNTNKAFIAVADFGRSGRVFLETDVAFADRETVISEILDGQIVRPIAVVAFVAKDCDVSREIAQEVVDRAWRDNITLTPEAREFAESFGVAVPEIERR